MCDVTDNAKAQLYVAPPYWERFRKRLPWAAALGSGLGFIHGVTAGRSGLAVVTYTMSAMATQAFIGAPVLTLLLAIVPNRRPANETELRDIG